MSIENTQPASTETGSKTGAVDYKALYENTENRRKDAQAALTPLQQEVAGLKAEVALHKSTPSQVSAEEQTRLDGLMYSDPQAWRREVNQLEATQTQQRSQAVETKKGEILAEMSQEDITVRTKVFFETMPEMDPKIVIDSMPKKLQEQLDDGTLSLEEALQKGVDLVNGATIASVLAPKAPNLGVVAGSRAPTDSSKVAQSSKDWNNTLV